MSILIRSLPSAALISSDGAYLIPEYDVWMNTIVLGCDTIPLTKMSLYILSPGKATDKYDVMTVSPTRGCTSVRWNHLLVHIAQFPSVLHRCYFLTQPRSTTLAAATGRDIQLKPLVPNNRMVTRRNIWFSLNKQKGTLLLRWIYSIQNQTYSEFRLSYMYTQSGREKTSAASQLCVAIAEPGPRGKALPELPPAVREHLAKCTEDRILFRSPCYPDAHNFVMSSASSKHASSQISIVQHQSLSSPQFSARFLAFVNRTDGEILVR